MSPYEPSNESKQRFAEAKQRQKEYAKAQRQKAYQQAKEYKKKMLEQQKEDGIPSKQAEYKKVQLEKAREYRKKAYQQAKAKKTASKNAGKIETQKLETEQEQEQIPFELKIVEQDDSKVLKQEYSRPKLTLVPNQKGDCHEQV